MSASLEHIRVLDLTTDVGELAGRLLADLGADVIKVEPPEGARSRLMAPFLDSTNKTDVSRLSLYWEAYGAGKRSTTLDLSDPTDLTVFLSLVDDCDVLIESFDPGRTHVLGIDQVTLRERNPQLIYASITPYGQSGPKAQWPASDLTIEAAGGRLAIQGDQDRPPVPVGFPQASLHGGAQAAADIAIALNERTHSGLGQYLDLSLQEAMWWTLMAAQGTPVCLGTNPPGSGDDRATAFVPQGIRSIPAKDGWVTIAPGGSPPGTKTMYTFAMEEAASRDELADVLSQYDWDQWTSLYRDKQIDPEHMKMAVGLLDVYVSRRTKLELIEWALDNNLRLGPINSTKDLLAFPHYHARDYFQEIGGISQPANWVRPSRTPLRFSPAPPQGDQEISWQRSRVPPSVPSNTNRKGLAFEGLKVADLSWVAAGPTIAKALADHGATVVKVESGTRPDLSRTLAPFMDGVPGFNRSYWAYLYGTSKLSLQCNLSLEGGRKLARRVCDWADIVVESFSPGTLARMGLDYETLSADKPELIMLSTSMLGQTGPLSRYAGYGQQATGFCGMHYVTGWADRIPCGVATPYTDVVAPKFGIAALSAAIYERKQSGIGQHIDLAQAECGMMFVAPLLLDEVVNAHTAERDGFNSPYANPQGVYPCAGTERYIAIAVTEESHWRALKQFLSNPKPDWDAPEFRRQQRDEVHATIEAMTSTLDPFVLEEKLISAGIPAAVIQRPMDVFRDPQIASRGLKQTLHHSECGDVVHYGFCTRFSARDEMLRTAAPCLGEHNHHVLQNLLECSQEEMEYLITTGVLN